MAKLPKIIRVGNTLGEGITWDTRSQCVWWTDIQDRFLYRYNWKSESLDRYPTPERLCSFGVVEGSDELIVAFETGFARYNPYLDSIAWLARIETPGSGIRFNDGRVDRQGRFWAGTMAENKAGAGQGRLYCLDGAGKAHLRETGVTISNSLCWSPDSTKLYYADTPRRVIWSYDFDAGGGTISGRQVFAETPEGAFPDGATVDAEGFLWSAQWGASRVVRYAPDGRVDRVLELPVSQPTCVSFGGPGLDLLFITSAREGLSKNVLWREISAGDVFVLEAGVKGLPEPHFRLGHVTAGLADVRQEQRSAR